MDYVQRYGFYLLLSNDTEPDYWIN